MRGVEYISIKGERVISPITAEELRSRYSKLAPQDRKILENDPDYQRYQEELLKNPDYRPVKALSFAAACELGLAHRVKDGESELDKKLAAAPTFEEHQSHVAQLINTGALPPPPSQQPIDDSLKTLTLKMLEAEHRGDSSEQIGFLIERGEEEMNLATHQMDGCQDRCARCGIFSHVARKVRCPNPR